MEHESGDKHEWSIKVEVLMRGKPTNEYAANQTMSGFHRDPHRDPQRSSQ